MIALTIEQAGEVGLTDVSEPALQPDEVLLRIRTVGFCGSDLNTFRGLNPLVGYPRIAGHEIAAVVERVGPEVPEGRFRPGMEVTVLPYTACGRCSACRRGRVNTCRDNQTLGVQRDGAMTELLATPWRTVIPGEGLSLRELALVEPLSVGFHAAARGRVDGTDTVAVIGCGAVGLGAVAGAAARGARVIAVDVDDRKLELARQSGAEVLLNSRELDLGEALRGHTGGEGPDVIIEAVGLPETFLAAVAGVAFAGRVVYIGYAKAPVSYDTSQFVKKELDILGSRNATADDFAAAMEALRKGALPVEEMVTRTVPLAEAGAALRAWDRDTGLITRIHVDLPDAS